MFTQKITKTRLFPHLLVGMLAMFLVSCGTQNKVYNQNDGIYNSGARGNQGETATNDNQSDRSNYYKQYFNSKANVYSELSENADDVIFTDVEAYATSERMDDQGNIIIEDNYNDGYGAWGTNSNDLTVNIYNTGGFGYGHYYPYYGWYRNYWGYPFYYNYYGPSWGFTFGWGWNYPFYGGYYYPYYYGGYYSYPYYPYTHHNNVVYNRGRRNTDYSRSTNRGRATNVSTRNSSYSRNETARRVNRNSVRANSNTVRSNSDHVIRNSRNSRINSSPNTIRNNRSIQATPQSNTRSNSTINSNVNTNRSSQSQIYSSPSRSSNNSSIRSSSGGGSRSSGTRTGGGRGRG